MRNILVTGVTRGMGKATAELLSKEGYKVYGVYNTNEEGAQRLKDTLNAELFQCDFSERESVQELLKRLSGISFCGVVNSAGVFEPIDFDKFDVTLWDKTFNVNVVAPLLLVQGLQGQLENGASIVNISSTDGMSGGFSGFAYSASKAALINLTQSLANLLAHKKIRVNAIAPGWIGDGMQAPPETLKEAAYFNPLGRNGTYEEMANIISFLLSDKSSYVNGATIVADGGDQITSEILQKEAQIRKTPE